MHFNISRQPLVPAFLTLAALTAATVGAFAHLPAPGPEITAGAGNLSGAVLPTPGMFLARFQLAHPGWSLTIAALLILYAGMCIGRMTVRYNLYAVNTCIAIPFYAIIACGFPAGNSYLVTFVSSVLLALSVRNFGRSFTTGYGFDGIFRAACYLGLLVLLLPAALPLALVVPLAVMLARRTFREAVVAVAGLMFPVLAYGYADWGLGGSFSTPFIYMWNAFVDGRFLSLFSCLDLPTIVATGCLVLLCLFASIMFLSNIYIVSAKPRFVLVLNIGIFLLTGTLFCGPAASEHLFALTAVPAAILLPVLFVRIHRNIALPLYLFLLAAAICRIFLQ